MSSSRARRPGRVQILRATRTSEIANRLEGSLLGVRTRVYRCGLSRLALSEKLLLTRLYSTPSQWIDLPPPFQLSSEPDNTHSASGPGGISSPASGSPHSPPIFKVPNRFFDSLTEADRARSKIGVSSGRHSLSTSAVPTLTMSSPVGSVPKSSSPLLLKGEGEVQANGEQQQQRKVEPHTIELQFQAECIAPFAHHGYVVRWVRALSLF